MKIHRPLLRLALRTMRLFIFFFDRVYHGVEALVIDGAWFQSEFPTTFRIEMARGVQMSLCPNDNIEFFANVGRYVDRHCALPSEIEVVDDLFPPNIAALDFLHKYARISTHCEILDYACGSGIMIVYLRKLGFKSFGYDNWSQLSRTTAQTFLSDRGIREVLLDDTDLSRHQFTVLNCAGIPWKWLTNLDSVLTQPSLEWILIDRHYRPKQITGFRPTHEYCDLLTVYRRIR